MKIQDTDILLLNQGGTDYKITALELKEKINEKPVMPWEDHVANGGAVLHVKDATGTVNCNQVEDAYDIDGTHKGKITSFGPGDEFVLLTHTEPIGFFDHYPDANTENWNFGELTDVSNIHTFVKMFMGCSSFNGTGMSEWDTSSAEKMGQMFIDCKAFNQDLSKWCVIDVAHVNFDQRANSWQDEFKPVWGTCPRGEDQS